MMRNYRGMDKQAADGRAEVSPHKRPLHHREIANLIFASADIKLLGVVLEEVRR